MHSGSDMWIAGLVSDEYVVKNSEQFCCDHVWPTSTKSVQRTSHSWLIVVCTTLLLIATNFALYTCLTILNQYPTNFCFKRGLKKIGQGFWKAMLMHFCWWLTFMHSAIQGEQEVDSNLKQPHPFISQTKGVDPQSQQPIIRIYWKLDRGLLMDCNKQSG